MTVERLIELLNTYPNDREVRICTLENDLGIAHIEDGVTGEGASCVVIMSDEEVSE